MIPQNNQTLVLAYWEFRGLAEPIRLVLEACNLEYTEKKFSNNKEGSDEWAELKPKLDFSFPNLPYLQDGDQIITESLAIIYHIVLKSNRQDLLGLTFEQKVKVQMVLGVILDFNDILVNQSYNPKYKDIFEINYHTKILPTLNNLNNHYIKHNTKFITGQNVTIADIRLFEHLQHCQHHYKESLEKMYGLQNFLQNMLQLQFIQKYQQSEKYVAQFFNSPVRSVYP